MNHEIDKESILESDKYQTSSKSLLKGVPNAVLFLLNGFMIAAILSLFLGLPKRGERVKPTIQKFHVNTEQYYSEDEMYHQVNANIQTYQSTGRPDEGSGK